MRPPQAPRKLTNTTLFQRILTLGSGLTAALFLAGCATQHNAQQTAELDDLLKDLRTEHAYRTQSDPLGSYLANRGLTDRTFSYARDELGRGSHAMAGEALDLLGVKYTFGGEDPSNGFDCSGLVGYVAEKSLGLKLPRSASELAGVGDSVARDDLKQGDLVFFNTRGARFSHVGIYIGDNKFVHAPRTGAVVRIEDITVPYWQQRYNGARRIDVNDSQIASR